jgi:hypothetical protein
MCSLRFENNLLTIEGVRFASISKKTPLSKLSFAFVSLALPLLLGPIPVPTYAKFESSRLFHAVPTYAMSETSGLFLCPSIPVYSRSYTVLLVPYSPLTGHKHQCTVFLRKVRSWVRIIFNFFVNVNLRVHRGKVTS